MAKKTEQREIDCKYAWFEANPPDKNGHWTCYLQIARNCPRTLTKETMVQEHVKAKARYPELKFVVSNRKASCTFCNSIKGSLDLEDLVETYPHLQKVIDLA